MIKNSNNNFKSKDIDEADFFKIINLILRNKILISAFTISLFIFSCIYSLTKKRVWEGDFQIVLRENKSVNSPTGFLAQNSSLIQSLNLGGNLQSNLKTEVGILQSSSVLMPIFEYFKEEKAKLNNNSPKITFSSWKSNLEIGLEKNTSILNISFRDNNKKLINSVLEKTIDIYQEYSGKGKSRELELAKKYLEKQINLYKVAGAQSMKDLQEFATDQDLTALGFSQVEKNSADFYPKSLSTLYKMGNLDRDYELFGKTINIEAARVRAANKIRSIEAKIKKIESLKSDEGLTYIRVEMPELVEADLMQDLTKLDLQLLELKSKYTEKYPEIARLEEKRRLFIKLLNKKSIGFLQAEKISAEAILEATTRPKGVLLKYKELARKAQRDDSTLVELENQKRFVSLQEAKLEDPWELITKPTIKTSPVAPRRSVIAFFGTIFGLFLGVCASIYKERKTGLIYEKDTLETILNTKIIDCIDLNNPNSNLFIKELFSQKKNNSFKFIYSKYLTKINPESLKNIFEDKKYNSSIVNDLTDLNDNEILILVVTIPQITFDEILKIKNHIEFLEKELFGILIIKNEIN